MMYNKKSQFRSFLINAILVLAFLVLTIIIIGSTMHKYEDIDKLNRCKNSVLITSAASSTGFGGVVNSIMPKKSTSEMEQIQENSGQDLECEIIFKTVKDSNEYYIKRTLANQMAGCWYKFNEGEINLFSGVKDKETDYCVICGVLSFEGVAKGQQIQGFNDFLLMEKTPRMFSNQVYHDYLTGKATSEEFREKLINQDVNIIDTNLDYMTMFYYPKVDYTTKVEGAIQGAKEGLGFGAIAKVVTKLFAHKHPVIRTISSLPIVSGSMLGGTIFATSKASSKQTDHAAVVMLFPYNPEEINNLDCEFPVPLGYRPD
ncbi:hypothetical protein HN695_06960 [Candidatus Woesearchaeota archaeon]|jgi:hypothetical protein|nr:hypothetical protein [Candidatus Woesearchaeota archaeon]MBT5271900.1 hypothetical protein [Candidatus Woesearchaeota archaeon]MBT6040693.1 hypothetical protein [Candidatus Woesearchaeota archaeon]MBT6336188.1 hypothetical protein [Candidatus Woesearchaeota archaeon]MBT7928045.1 hypothetical protein [Candidatus Woesearchaeota archaeon]